MAAGNSERDELLTELLAALDERLLQGTSEEDLDTSAIDGDDELAAEWAAGRRCLEKLDRVRRHWSPDQVMGDTPAPGAADVTPDNPLACSLGRFRILRELGHGGLGLVYLAYDPKLGRQVALKIPRPDALASSGMRKRFLREAEAAARLSHPHLVAVFDVGEEGPLCYIASEFCPGPTLAQWIKESRQPVPVHTAARMLRQLASAVQHAHGRGVLHRDIKPSNVLLANPAARDARPGDHATDASPDSAADELWPKLTDFGMAKLLEQEGDATRSGTLVGTPAYMAPEQARGQVRELDARTDVYALGAVFYELLTGRRVFQGTSDIEALRQVLFEEPANPRKLRADIPRDLEAICLKCLAKSSDARYTTAQQLVEDIDRFLAGKPTEARPLSAPARLWSWARRRPMAAALAAVTSLAAIALLATVMIYNGRLSVEIARAEREAEASEQLLYTADVRLAYEALQAKDVVQARELLDRHVPRAGRPDLREFAWYHLRERCQPATINLLGHQGTVFSVAWSPDGSRLATGGKDHTVRIWDAETGRAVRLLAGHSDEVTSVAFSADGATLASGSEDRTVRFWDSRTGEPGRVLEHGDEVLSIAFSPDGSLLATGGRDAVARLWSVATGELVITRAPAQDAINTVGFTRAGDLFFIGDDGGHFYVWKAPDWTAVAHSHLRKERIFSAAALGDGRVAVAGRAETITVFDPAKTRSKIDQEVYNVHKEWVRSLARSPTAPLLASAGSDRVIQLWRLPDLAPYRTLLGHTDAIWSVAWSPDGERLASASADGQVKLWSLDSETPQRHGLRHPTSYPALSPAGELVFADDGRELTVWSIDNHVEIARVQPSYEPDFQIVLSPDGRLAATADGTNDVVLYQVPQLQEIGRFPAAQGAPKCLAWTPQGDHLAHAIDAHTVVVRNVVSGQIERRFEHPQGLRRAAFSVDGHYVATSEFSLEIREPKTGQMIFSHPGGHHELAVARDRSLIAASTGSNVTIVDLTGGHPQAATLVTIGADVSSLAIDGQTLAVGISHPAAVSLWDLRTRQLLMRLHCDCKSIGNVAFSPDGRRLVATGEYADRTGCIWEWTIRK